MIKIKNDLKYYLECDRIALRAKTKKPIFFSDEIWRFEILLRKREYLSGVPARVISENISHNNLVLATEIVEKSK